MPHPFQITTDGVTVWVNGPVGTLGRFGKLGIDVHSADNDQCLHCTHQETTPVDWDVFRDDMWRFHQIHVSDRFKPARFRST